MKRYDVSRAAKLCGLTCALVVGATACGGVIQFRDQSAIAIAGKGPPPPPPPEPEPEPDPPKEKKRVEVKEDRIEINEKIQFAYNDAKILDASFPLLEDIAKVLKDNKQIKKVQIGGHASTDGSDSHNMDLSGRRANSVRKWLIEKGGIKDKRLESKGFGETKPLVTPEQTDADREKNRRVEFLIVDPPPKKKKKSDDAKKEATK